MRRHIALRMLAHDRATTAGAVLGVVAIIFLVGQQLAVLNGLFSYMSVLVDHSGADIWITSEGTDNVNSAGDLPTRYVHRLVGLDELEWVEPVVSGAGFLKRKDAQFQPVRLVGVRPPRMVGGPWDYEVGDNSALLDHDAITVDWLDRRELGDPEIGDVLEINGRRCRVAAFTRGARGFSGTLIFTNEQKAREVGGVPDDRCSSILVKLRPGADPGLALSRIRALLPRASATPTPELSANTRLFYVTQTGIGTSFGFSTLIGVVVGVVIIILTMYATVLNRQRDFAVLRALGARRRDIRVIVLYQALFIGLIGILVGFFLLAGFLFGTSGTRLPSFMPLWIPPVHALLTLALCAVGSALAIRRAVKIEPASAFR